MSRTKWSKCGERLTPYSSDGPKNGHRFILAHQKSAWLFRCDFFPACDFVMSPWRRVNDEHEPMGEETQITSNRISDRALIRAREGFQGRAA